MKKTISIPNHGKYIVAIALATDPSDTLAFLLEVGVIAQREIVIMRGLVQGLHIFERHLLDHPQPLSNASYWSQLGAVQGALNALDKPDAQAYLAFKARTPLASEDLAHAMAAISMTGRHYVRPWNCTWGEFEVGVWREIFSSQEQSAPELGAPALIAEAVQ